MKRWTKEAVELLKLRSEQSRRGEPVTPQPGSKRKADSDHFRITQGKPGSRQPKNTVAYTIVEQDGRLVELRLVFVPGRRSYAFPLGF